MVKGTFTKFFWVFLVLSLLSYLAYSTSFNVPFYLDDFGSIVNNANLHDASFSSLFSAYGLRTIGYVSFWADFSLYKLSPVGYHLTNLIIHVLNGALVFVLLRKLINIAKTDVSDKTALYVSVVGALLFLLHPLHTQAVTYIVQRLASLVAFFYLLSMCCFIFARTASQLRTRFVLFSLALIAAICALLTKQNAVTLPFALLLLEWIFFNRKVVNKLFIAVCVLLIAIVPVYLVFPDDVAYIASSIDTMTRETTGISRWDYFCTQLYVLWIYIGKFFWPASLHLDYGDSVSNLAKSAIALAALAHACTLTLALYLRRKLPLISFGILFFYVAHLVESSVIPIRDLVFEHRSYLPDVGLILALCALSLIFIKFVKTRGAHIVVATSVCAVLALLGYLTYERNNQWSNPEQFYENELAHNPTNVRTIHNYAEYVGRQGDLEKAEQLIKKMYEVSGGKLDGAMVNTHIVLLMSQGKYRDAVGLARRLLEQDTLHPRTRVYVLSNVGIVYTRLGRYASADKYFREAYPSGEMTVKGLTAYAFSLIKNGYPLRALKVIDDIKRLQPNDKKIEALTKMATGLQADAIADDESQESTPPLLN